MTEEGVGFRDHGLVFDRFEIDIGDLWERWHGGQETLCGKRRNRGGCGGGVLEFGHGHLMLKLPLGQINSLGRGEDWLLAQAQD